MGISYSAYTKYHTCPKMYDLHYNEGLRPTKKSFAMILGSVCDEAFNKLILEGVKEVDLSSVVVTDLEFKNTEIDLELIPAAAKETILIDAQAKGYSGDCADTLMATVVNAYIAGQDLTDNQLGTLEATVLIAMRVKADCIVATYEAEVLPRLGKIEAVQRYIPNGVIDLVAELDGDGIHVIDNKVSATWYKDDSVEMSPQLAKYCHNQGIMKAAFIKMSSSLSKNKVKTCLDCGHVATSSHATCNADKDGKRCNGTWEVTIHPTCSVQVIKSVMSARMLDQTAKAFDETFNAIDGNFFPANLNACNYLFGKPCPYKNYCHNGDSTGLEKKETK